MIRRLTTAFTDHPASVGESYAEHAGFAAGFGTTLIVAGLAALVHALLPFACRTTASDTVLRMNDFLVARRRQSAQTATRSDTPETAITAPITAMSAAER